MKNLTFAQIQKLSSEIKYIHLKSTSYNHVTNLKMLLTKESLKAYKKLIEDAQMSCFVCYENLTFNDYISKKDKNQFYKHYLKCKEFNNQK